jgi:hypothetical protein
MPIGGELKMQKVEKEANMDIATTYRIDFDSAAGAWRKIHGVNGGPLSCGTWLDHSKFFAQMEPPGIRLHDSMWPGTVVDLHIIFPDFGKDANDPASYVFPDTDHYMKAVAGTGADILYRLGHSAGGFGFGRGWPYPGKRPGNLRPADFDQWVAICLGVIRHYNDGWANGFHHGIRKWEVWNEANSGGWWNGTPGEFYDLYERFARSAKKHWPDIEVGGFGWVYPDNTSSEESVAVLDTFVEGFLKHCSTRDVPLDFVTWHSYFAWPETALVRSRHVRARLEAHGLSKVRDFLDEWSITSVLETGWGHLFDPKADPERRRISFDARHGAPGAAGAACVLSLLQDSETSAAYYYAADANPFGMFDVYGTPYKNFYALKAFNRLCRHPQRVAVEYIQTMTCPTEAFDRTVTAHHSEVRGVTVLAGKTEDGRAAAILLSNYNNPCREYHLDLRGPAEAWNVRAFLLDDRHDLEETTSVLSGKGLLHVFAPPASVVLLLLDPKRLYQNPCQRVLI